MTDSNYNFFKSVLFSPIARVTFLATALGFVFFISEHEIEISKTTAFVEDIEKQESWAAGGNKLRQLSFLFVASVGALSLLLGRAGKFRLNLPVILIGLYVLWAGASFTWSIDPGATSRRYIVVLCCIIGCFGFSRFLRVKDAVLAAVFLSVGYLGIGVITEIFFGSFRPHVGGYRFAGTIHPNIQAANLAMGSIAAFTMARVRPKLNFVFYSIFGVLFLFLVLTKCRSATATVPVALAIIWLTSQPSRNIFVGVAGGIWLTASVALFCLIAGFDPIAEYQEVLLLGRGEETGSSLTGRLPLWEDLSTYIYLRPSSGYGYRAFWTPRHIYEIAVSQEWVISEAHSTYIDSTLQLGIVGAVTLFLTELTTFFYAAFCFRKTQRPEYLFLVGGVFFCLIRGFTESGLGDPSAVTAFLFLTIGAHCWNARREIIDKPKTRTRYPQLPLQNTIPQA